MPMKAIVKFTNIYDETVIAIIEATSISDLHAKCKTLGHRYEILRRYY